MVRAPTGQAPHGRSHIGELLVGWEPVRASWESQAPQRLGGHVGPEEFHHFESESLGVAVGFERGSVEIDGAAMIGHHTDPLGS